MPAIHYRNTPQRKLVLDIVKSGQDHLGADEVYEEGRNMEPHISLAQCESSSYTLRRA